MVPHTESAEAVLPNPDQEWMMDKPATAPLACAPGGIPAADRPARFPLAVELFGAVRERQALEDG